MLNYEEATNWIHAREKFKVKPGIKRMEWMMKELGNPEKQVKGVHIAGTNGKGSTVAFLRHILQEQGYKVGTFTSPYIISFNERISINGTPVENNRLAQLVGKIKPLAEKLSFMPLGEPTEFEIITAMAMIYFSESQPDYVLFETGLGGRYDSTNIITPAASVITNVGMDHMNILGNTYEEIAMEKAGIIKPNVPVISGVRQPDAQAVIQEQARELQAPLFQLAEDFFGEHLEAAADGETFNFVHSSYRCDRIVSRLKGAHQIENASLAIETLEVLRARGEKIDRSCYRSGVEKTSWPARFEKVKDEPEVILDGAHNLEGTRALVETIKHHYKDKKVYLLYAALEDKPVHQMLTELGQVIDEAWFTTFDFPRALSAEELMAISPIQASFACENGYEAVNRILNKMKDEDLFLITGSLYYISQIRQYFKQ
ncbi:bifunctional folylpolyglutamate synthase/dihydrofolate synthase [Halobacillus salinarum]|uniref:tetrahydrofolate synthase n=1 Tax=Halobacillus salinarum TaxID=2932257 RepID=A0ABY4ERG3_9BACI|nr:folylpolyglutamate synthase/dihydrofolate synthase family protein [Halobacillus salinarum]UOQ46244.1 bifunctional folylpolyglutamate synthase/dihydrofolate synthase [Halobacillus salinarum]